MTEAEVKRKQYIENTLEEGFRDRADIDEKIVDPEESSRIAPEGPIGPEDALGIVRSDFALQDANAGRPKEPMQALARPETKTQDAPVTDDAWSMIISRVWPQLGNILTTQLGYAGRTPVLTTVQRILDEGYTLPPGSRSFKDKEGKTRSVADLIKHDFQQMRANGKLGM